MFNLRYLLAVAVAVVALCLTATTARAELRVEGFETSMSSNQAGSTTDYNLKFTVGRIDPDNPSSRPSGTIKDQLIDLPAGFVGDPTMAVSCPMARITQFGIAPCPLESVVGVAQLRLFNPSSGTVLPTNWIVRVYRLDTLDGEAAAFGFKPASAYTVRLSVTVDPENGYRVRVSSRNQQAGLPAVSADVTMWGVPAEHQGPGAFSELAYPGGSTTFGGPMPASTLRKRFTSVPARCDGEALTTMHLASWQYREFLDPLNASAGTPTGCEELVFSPAFDMTPSVAATATPSGYRAVLQVGQNADPNTPRTPNLKDAVVTLPAGVAISPAAGNGLVACTDGQLQIDSADREQCPAGSKIGDVTIESPVLDDAVSGEVFAGSQLSNDPASGEMYRIFLVATAQGVKVKLRGQVAVDPGTGQITARFLDNPDLPVERMTLNFKGGERAPLTTPSTCGDHSTQSTFTSWAGQSVSLSSPMKIDEGCGARAFAPSTRAGVAEPEAGAFSPLSFTVAREDGSKELKAVRSVRLPEGLLGKVGAVPVCGEAEAAAGTCPEASRVGHVQVAAGAGATPVWVPQAGKEPTGVYLTGPYRGAPYGLSIKVPAQAGPFDLGVVVVRSALRVDPRTAAITADTDDMPTMLGGVPLQVREVRLIMDRSGFTLNPTSCAQKSIGATLVSVDGDVHESSSRFRVADCALLAFQPKLAMRLSGKGRTRTGAHPGLSATLRQAGGQANIAKARVTLPKAVVLDPSNSTDPALVCDYDKGQAADCPASSIIGKATATTPLLGKPLTGDVHLVQGIRFGPTGNRIRTTPSLLVKLRGEIDIDLRGETTVANGRLVTTFARIPDAPVSRFDISIDGGKKGILVITRTRKARIDICAGRQTANVRMDGQNGKRAAFATTVRTPCKAARRAKNGKK